MPLEPKVVQEYQVERWNRFLEGEEWKILSRRIDIELNKNINGVRSTAKVTGKEKECAGYCGAADALELVTRLPEIIKRELVAKGDRDNG